MSAEIKATPKFQQHYAQWGPQVTYQKPSMREAQKYCLDLATSHYENFPVVTWLLPRDIRPHFYAIYAFCRWADDLGDELEVASGTDHPLNWWREQTLACYRGETQHPVFVALEETIHEYSIPPKPFLDLISAFEQDQWKKEYTTFAELLDYCSRSADPVGELILYLARSHTPENLPYSNAICSGLQLANFWQDVKRDAEMGRIYLPREDLEHYGVSPTDFWKHPETSEFQAVMQFQVERAEDMLRAGAPLFQKVPRWLKHDLLLFQRGGLAILSRIRKIHYRVLKQRPKLSKWDFLQISLRSLWG